MPHDNSECTDQNRVSFLQDLDWRYWPADKSLTRNNESVRLTIEQALASEIAGAKQCPVCGVPLE